MSDTDRSDTGHPDMPDARAADTSPDTALTLQEAAERAGVHERTVRRWITSGRLHAAKTGGQYRIALADLDASVGTQPDTARAPDTGTGQDRPGTGHEDRPESGQAGPDTGHPVSVDLAPVADLIGRLTRENAELSATAAMWQARAGFLEDQLKQLTATVESTTVEDASEAGQDEPGEQAPAPRPGESVDPPGAWARLWRWWRR